MTIFLLLGSVIIFFFSKISISQDWKKKKKKKTPGPNIGTAPKLCHKALKKGMDIFGMIDGIMS
jgi:hypothetical protein